MRSARVLPDIRTMKKLTFDEMRLLLPDLDELRPVVEHLLGESAPDADRQWAGSGELGTAGGRLVDVESLREAGHRLAAEENAHLEWVFDQVVTATECLAAGDHSEAARAFLALAEREEGRDRAGRAAAYADSAFRAAQSSRDLALTALALRRRARARLALGDHKAAELDYVRAQDMTLAAGDARGQAEGAIGAGNVLEEQGRWDAAETWYRGALDALADVDPHPAEAWHAFLNLHVLMRSRGQLSESLVPLVRAEEIAAGLEDDGASQFLENARGQWHMAQSNFDGAISHLQAALAASRGARATVTIRLNLAEAFMGAGRPLEAAEEARGAEREAIIARLVRKLPEVYRLLGAIAATTGNPDAFVLFERSLQMIDAGNLPALERAVTLQAYADAEARVGLEETSERLQELADQIYHELGIDHRRGAWADHYGSDAEHDDD